MSDLETSTDIKNAQAASKLIKLDPPLRIAKFDADEAKVILL